MTVNEVLKNVNKSLVHFAIFESTNSTESMYENIDTIKIRGRRGKFVHPKFLCTLEELEDREVCDIFPDYCPEFYRYDETISNIYADDATIEPVLVIVVKGKDK